MRAGADKSPPTWPVQWLDMARPSGGLGGPQGRITLHLRGLSNGWTGPIPFRGSPLGPTQGSGLARDSIPGRILDLGDSNPAGFAAHGCQLGLKHTD